MSELQTRYLFQCKSNYYDNIRPSRRESFNEDGYLMLVEIAKTYFAKDELSHFAAFFQEYQYCVNLWTAHLIIEYGEPNIDLKRKAIEIIKRYSTTPLNEELAKEEKEWLLKNKFK